MKQSSDGSKNMDNVNVVARVVRWVFQVAREMQVPGKAITGILLFVYIFLIGFVLVFADSITEGRKLAIETILSSLTNLLAVSFGSGVISGVGRKFAGRRPPAGDDTELP